MLWVVSEAVAVCAARRLRRVAAANPALGAAAALALPALAVAAAVAGARARTRFDELLGDDGFAAALALAIAATGLVVGLTAMLAVPRIAVLASPFATAPIRRLTLVAGTTVLPLLALGASGSVPLLAFALAVAGWKGASIVAAVAASSLVGAAVAEAIRTLLGRSARGLLVCAGAAAVWLLPGLVTGGALAAGPAAPLAPILRTGDSTAVATLVCATLAALVLWVAACAAPRAERSARRELRRDAGLPRLAFAAMPIATVRALLRHHELRLPAAASVAAPVAAAVALYLAFDDRGEPLLAFAALLTLLAVPLFHSAAQGLFLDAASTLRVAPRSRAGLRALSTVGGVAVGAGLVALTAGALAPVARASATTYAELEPIVALVLGAAAAAGAVLPWRGGRVVEQLAAYGAALGVAFVLSTAVGAVAPSSTLALVLGNGVLLTGLGAAALAR